MIFWQNLILNFLVTIEDVDVAKKIFGVDLPKVKCNYMRPKPPQVVDDVIEIKREMIDNNQMIDVVMDIILSNEFPFLMKIDWAIKFWTTVTLDNQSAKIIYCALD